MANAFDSGVDTVLAAIAEDNPVDAYTMKLLRLACAGGATVVLGMVGDANPASMQELVDVLRQVERSDVVKSIWEPSL